MEVRLEDDGDGAEVIMEDGGGLSALLILIHGNFTDGDIKDFSKKAVILNQEAQMPGFDDGIIVYDYVK
eukprot:11469758-Karenia_brevis.AAC.1